MTQARALLSVGVVTGVVAGALVWMAAGEYSTARQAWRSDAGALGSVGYDAARSDAHYELAETALARVRRRSHALGLGLLLALTGAFGLRRREHADAARRSASPARALAVIWLDSGICAGLLVLNLACMPHDARLLAAITGSLVPWLMATLLTAPVAAGFTLAGLVLGTRLRDDAGERPSPLRALATLLLLPLTLFGAIVGLPVHLAMLASGRHPGSHRVSVHLAMLGLHGIRWRQAEPAA